MTKILALLLTVLTVTACHAERQTAASSSDITTPAVVQDKEHGRKRQSDKGNGRGRKCPADKVTIGGQDVPVILNMMGAEGEAGATDNELISYSGQFNRSDSNLDGKLSKKEYVEGGNYMTPQARRGIFIATDNNADGVVTRVEYVLNRIITDEGKSIIQPMDTDRNRKIDKSEFLKGSPLKDKELAAAVFDALDTSGDGMITIPEYLRVWGGWARPDYKKQEAAISIRLTTK